MGSAAGRVKRQPARFLLLPFLVLWLSVLLISGCANEPPYLPETYSGQTDLDDKARPPSQWAGRARQFAANLPVQDMVATPTRLFVTTRRDGAEKLVTLDEQGNEATFSFVFTADAATECYVEISLGWNPGFPVDEIWVSRGAELLQLSPLGDQMNSIAMLPVADGEIVGLCFDDVGSFGYQLLILTESGNVFSLSAADAPIALLGYIGVGGRSPDVASLGFGTHAGQLLVSYPAEDVVRGMTPEATVSYVVGWSGVSAAKCVPTVVREYGRSNGALFLALDNGQVYRFDADDMGPLSDNLVMTSLYRSGSGVATPMGVGYTTRAFSRFWGSEVCATFVRPPAVTVIDLTIDPGTTQPSIAYGSTDLVPVALLSSAWFWPAHVDVGEVSLAGALPVPFGKSGAGTWVDLNDDGILDLTLYFRPVDMQVEVGLATLSLIGQTLIPEEFRGSASVVVTAP